MPDSIGPTSPVEIIVSIAQRSSSQSQAAIRANVQVTAPPPVSNPPSHVEIALSQAANAAQSGGGLNTLV